MSNLTPLKRPFVETMSPKRVKISIFDSSKENIPPKNGSENDSSTACEKRTPKKDAKMYEDPVTPTTNFKLLTTLAAERDYASCNSPKSQHCSQESSLPMDEKSSDSECLDPSLMNKSESGFVNRKDKSLALICTRFLAMYPDYPSAESRIVVSLDEACYKLRIERRRLYDIVNVFESIEMLQKLQKNRYQWFGKRNLLKALYKIKTAALKENIPNKLQYVLNVEKNLLDSKSCILDEVEDFKSQSSSTAPELFRATSPFPEMRKDKSLAIMSQKFLMLFLVSPANIISLGVAAKVLNGFNSCEKGAQIKTQIRRLYDIANVLTSIGLIKKEVKIVQSCWRKPAYKYIGPDFFDINAVANVQDDLNLKANLEKSRSLIRHSSFQEMCAVAEMEHKRLFFHEDPSSAPPFEQSFLRGKIDVTRPSPVISSSRIKSNYTEAKLKSDTIPVSSAQSNQFHNVSNRTEISTDNGQHMKTSQKPATLSTLPATLKVVNVPKEQIDRIARKNGYYVLNPNKENPKRSGAFLLLNTFPLKQAVIQNPEKVPEKKIPKTKTIQVSPLQRDMILKSLNISLSDGQVASIKLDGSANSLISTQNSDCNVLKILDKNEIPVAPEENNTLEPSYKVKASELDGNYFRSLSSNGNNIRTRVDSPLRLPTGLMTPTPSSSSSFSFSSPSESEFLVLHSKLKNNVLDVSSTENAGQEKENASELTFKSKVSYVNNKVLKVVKERQPLDTIQNLPTPNSCSSDSLNSEVSDILQDKKLQIDAGTDKPFLFDEKTILSPIKIQSPICNLPNPTVITSHVNTGSTFLLNYFGISTPNNIVLVPPLTRMAGESETKL